MVKDTDELGDSTKHCRNANYFISEVRQQLQRSIATNMLNYFLAVNGILRVKLVSKCAPPPLCHQVRQINSLCAGEDTVLTSQSRGMRKAPVTAGSQVQGLLKKLFLTHAFSGVYSGLTHNSSTR